MNTTTQRTPGEQAEAGLSGLFLFLGVALIILGGLAVAFAPFATMGTVLVFGALLVAAGVVELAHTFRVRAKEKVFWNVVSGLLYIIAGVLTMYHPFLGAMGLTLVISAFLFISGIVQFVYAIKHRERKNWGWMLAGGILNIVLGAIIATGWPLSGLWVIGLFLGIQMIVYGCAWIAMAVGTQMVRKRYV